MRGLVLEEGDGRLFERIYDLAAQLTDPQKAKELRARNACAGPRFWRGAFNELGGDDKVLISAVLQTLNVPFGAYVLSEKSPERLEITPWLFTEEGKAALSPENLSGADAEALYSASRSLSLTADFLVWLQKRSENSKRG